MRFTLTDLVAGINAAKFDLSFLAEARPGGLWLECSYKTSLFDEDRIDPAARRIWRSCCAAPSPTRRPGCPSCRC